jgi:hypothetical protein
MSDSSGPSIFLHISSDFEKNADLFSVGRRKSTLLGALYLIWYESVCPHKTEPAKTKAIDSAIDNALFDLAASTIFKME